VVDTILSYNSKNDVLNKCGGPAQHVSFLLQDSVDENLEWKDDVDKQNTLYLVSELIDKKFKYTDKNQQFNLGDKLIDLTSHPFGLYQSYAGMGMVAFAMRKYIKQIFDLNGKPREAQHLADDIVEMFKSLENDKSSSNLNFRFETKESRSLCENFISLFKLNTLKGYSDISSLTDARWAITHEFSKQTGYPLWVLKYVSKISDAITVSEGLNSLIENILKICGEADIRNPVLLNETLNGIERYRFEFGNLLNKTEEFENGFISFLKSIEIVKLQDEEIKDAKEYIVSHLQGEVGLWTENEVKECLTHWRIEYNRLLGSEVEPIVPEPDVVKEPTEQEELQQSKNFTLKRTSALNKVKQISNVNQAKKLLETICENSNETIIDIINNYDE